MPRVSRSVLDPSLSTPQQVALGLLIRGLRDLLDELEVAGDHEERELDRAELEQLLRREAGAGLQLDEGLDVLLAEGARDPDHDRFEDLRVPVEDRLHIVGCEVLAPRRMTSFFRSTK